jgi:hypothetical protein
LKIGTAVKEQSDKAKRKQARQSIIPQAERFTQAMRIYLLRRRKFGTPYFWSSDVRKMDIELKTKKLTIHAWELGIHDTICFHHSSIY